MYVPHEYRFESTAALVAFAQAHPFATLVSVADGVPQAALLPVVVTPDGDGWRITGHGARANPQLAAMDGADVLVQFTGPHAYVSPRLYDRTQSVPTWNYSAVQARGTARLVRDADAGIRILEALIGQSEPGYLPHWASLDPVYRQHLFDGIILFEIAVTAWDGAQKWSQDRTPEEQARIAAALLERDAPAGQFMQTLLASAAPH